MIDKLTPQDISNIAKKYLDLNKVALTVVHPSNTKPEDINNNYKAAESISFTGANKKTPIKMENVSEYKLPNNYDVILNDSNSDLCTNYLASDASHGRHARLQAGHLMKNEENHILSTALLATTKQEHRL